MADSSKILSGFLCGYSIYDCCILVTLLQVCICVIKNLSYVTIVSMYDGEGHIISDYRRNIFKLFVELYIRLIAIST